MKSISCSVTDQQLIEMQAMCIKEDRSLSQVSRIVIAKGLEKIKEEKENGSSK